VVAFKVKSAYVTLVPCFFPPPLKTTLWNRYAIAINMCVTERERRRCDGGG